MDRVKSVLLGALLVFIFSVPGWCQANVNESLETASVYVDAVYGSDGNPGTAGAPLKTIGAAVSIAETNNQNSIGTKVIVNPGVYREAVTINGNLKTTSLPITFQAATSGTAIVSGADIWTGWAPYSGNSNIYTNAWPYTWGLCAPANAGPPQADIVLRREMVFVNGTMLTGVLSLSEMAAGTFYVDEPSGKIYVWPPLGTNMSTATVEVSTRPQVWSIESQSYVVTRGLTFQYANPCWANGAVVTQGNSSNLLFDSDSFNWNSAEGLQLWNGTTYYTVQNSVANHNGESGFAVYQVKNGLLKSDVAAFNDWRGAQGAYYGWDNSGFHFTGDHTDTLTNLQSYYNQSEGLHYDTDNENITINGFASNNDLTVGLFFEVTQGPVSVSGASICAANPPASSAVTALGMRDSEYISVSGSNFINAPYDIGLVETPGGTWVTNWETGQQQLLYTEHFSLNGSVVEAGSGQDLFNAGSLVSSEWTDFQSTLAANNNTWWDASNSTAFVVPVPANNSAVNFSSWQSTTGQDLASVWAPPTGTPSAACTGAPDMTDFWFVIENNASPLTISSQFAGVFTATVVPLNFTGTVQLSYDGIQDIPGATGSWSAASLGPNGSANFTVTPSPTTPNGTYPIVLIASSGSLTHTLTVMLTIDNAVQFSSTSLNFGNQLIKTTSSAQSITVKNTSSVALTGLSVSVTGANTNDFSETNTCGTSLAAKSSCTITVTFTPGATGSRLATLSISDSDPTSPQQVALSGTGTQPVGSLSPSSLSFGSGGIGVQTAPQTLTLSNTGTAPLTITSVAMTGSNPTDFAETNTCGSTVPAGGACAISVTFTATKTGNRYAKVTVTDNATPATQTASLTGTGVQTQVKLSTTSLNFGNQLIQAPSPPQSVTVTNTGSLSLTNVSVSVTGTNATDFAQTNTCSLTLPGNSSCTVTVTFTPAATGSRGATLDIYNSDPTSPQQVALSGTGTQPGITFSPGSLSFGSQTVGTKSAAQTVTVTNTGTANLSVTSVAASGDFAETNTCTGSIAPNVTCSISVTFTPTAAGSRTGWLTITDNAPASPQAVGLTGTGTAGTQPGISFSPSSLSFASQTVGTKSAAQTITVTNTGTANLSVTSIAASGDFAETNTCTGSIAPNATCSISVTFTPTAAGSRTGSLTITDNAPASPQPVGLTGTGTQAGVSFSPASLTFAGQAVGTTSAAQTVTVTNTGTANLSITSIAASGDFAETNTCTSSIAPTATCSISVTFTPTAAVSRTGSLTVTDNAPASPQTVGLTGTGTQAGVAFSPASLTFASQLVGTTSPAQSLTVTNTGTANLSITSVAASGDFAETNTCASSIAPTATCSISVTFTPTAAGSRTGSLTVADNAPASPQTVGLTGTGTQAGVAFSPASLTFASQLLGTTSLAQAVTVTNTGTANLSITSIAASGDFAETNTCTSSIAPNATCSITATFTPTAAGTRTGSLTVTDNAPASPQNVGLIGTGSSTGTPGASLSPSSITFANQPVGTSSSPQAFTLTNSGTASLTINSVAVTGSDPGDFTETNNCGLSLTAGASCSINVTFTPTRNGNRSAQITITDNASPATQSAGVSGNGTK
jgi:hypothetical protein